MAWFVDEAIKQNIKTSDVYAGGAPRSALAMQKAVEWMKAAARYRIELPLIPHGDEARFDALVSQYAHGLKPREKFTVIEYEHGGRYDAKIDLTRALATKRFALCVDLDSEHAVDMSEMKGYAKGEKDDGGLLVWSMNYFEEKRDWEIAPGAAIIDRYQVREVLAAKPQANLSGMLRNAKNRLMDSRKPPEKLFVRYIEMLPEICASLGDDHRKKAVFETNLDAVWVALGFFSAWDCANVALDEAARALYVDKKINGKNERVPLDPYHGRRVENQKGEPKWEQNTTFKTPD